MTKYNAYVITPSGRHTIFVYCDDPTDSWKHRYQWTYGTWPNDDQLVARRELHPNNPRCPECDGTDLVPDLMSNGFWCKNCDADMAALVETGWREIERKQIH